MYEPERLKFQFFHNQNIYPEIILRKLFYTIIFFQNFDHRIMRQTIYSIIINSLCSQCRLPVH